MFCLYSLIEVDLFKYGRRKLIHYFSDINAIVFIADCSDFDCIKESYDQFGVMLNYNNK